MGYLKINQVSRHKGFYFEGNQILDGLKSEIRFRDKGDIMCEMSLLLGVNTLNLCSLLLLPVEGREKAAGRQHERSPGQDGASVIDPLQVTPRHVGHADSPRRAVQELIAIPANGESSAH